MKNFQPSLIDRILPPFDHKHYYTHCSLHPRVPTSFITFPVLIWKSRISPSKSSSGEEEACGLQLLESGSSWSEDFLVSSGLLVLLFELFFLFHKKQPPFFFLQLSTFFLFFKNFLFCIRVQLINSVALVLGVPQSDSVICILVSIFKFFSHFYKNALESKHRGNKLLLLLSHFSHVQLCVTP